jgi:hypothetical protein
MAGRQDTRVAAELVLGEAAQHRHLPHGSQVRVVEHLAHPRVTGIVVEAPAEQEHEPDEPDHINLHLDPVRLGALHALPDRRAGRVVPERRDLVREAPPEIGQRLVDEALGLRAPEDLALFLPDDQGHRRR